jgi:hypothetical protein
MDRRLAAGRSLLPGVGVTVLGVAVSALVGWAAPAVGLLGAAAVVTWHPARPPGPLVFRSFPGAALVRGARGHAGDEWFVDLGA